MAVARRSGLTPAQQAHLRRVGWYTVAYLFITVPLVWLRATHAVGQGWSIALALAAAVPSLGMFASWGRYLSDEQDEYHQSVALRRSAIATNATMGTAIAWGALQAFRVLPLVAAYWLPLVWVVAQSVAAAISYARERGAGA